MSGGVNGGMKGASVCGGGSWAVAGLPCTRAMRDLSFQSSGLVCAEKKCRIASSAAGLA